MPDQADARALIKSTIAVLDPQLRQLTYPLFAVDNQDRPDLHGSSVLLEVDGHTVLVTAAHVVSDISKIGSTVHVGATDAILALPAFARTSLDGKDPLDLAAVRVPDDLLRHFRTPLPMSEIFVVPTPHMRCIHGYPASKNKQYRSVDESRRVFVSEVFTYAGASQGLDDEYVSCKKSRDLHIALRYQKNSRNAEGDRVQPPDPYGMSGGGLWQVPDIHNPNLFLLEGISVDYHQRGAVVFATRIEQVIQFVRQNCS